MIDRATVDKILDAAQIVDVVGDFVTLRKSGVNYKGLCPFHDDKNPSFMVSPAKNICHCFVCGKGGTPAGFLMEHEQMSYPEALRWLARKYNIEIVEREQTDEERREQTERESMFVVNEWACQWFHDTLKNDPDGVAIGRQYFRSRGIRDDIVEKFALGYAPQRRDALATAALKKGFKADYLLKTGLCYSRDEQPLLVDRYRGRVIFPWHNVSGKVVAFGGRLLDQRTKGVAQKYVNSPDSDIYHKERELYGIYQAKRAIVKDDRVFMVEGYTDVIAMHQAGIENVVANSGTALSQHQIRLLHRFTQNITLLYDGDEAGIHAAMRGTDMLLADGMNIRVLLLPDGHDPDSFARAHSAEELRDYIANNQQDFISFKTRLTVEGISDPVKRSEGISGIVKSISVIPDPILRSTYLSDLASRLGLKEQTLISTMNKFIRQEKENRLKEQERQAHAAATTTPPQADATATGITTGGTATTDTTDATPPQDAATARVGGFPPPNATTGSALPLETLLVREVIRHGEEVVFDQVENDDGQTVSLNVAQYLSQDLAQDGIQFTNPLYNQILAEAVAHSDEPGFRAEHYFTSHPDIDVSQLAARLATDRHQLGGRFVITPREGAQRQRLLHLVMDYRMSLVNKRLHDIQDAMRQAMGNMESIMALMQEYKDIQELRNTLARRLGSDVMTTH